MKLSANLPQLSKNEFEVFLLIYAAHVDYEFSEEEIAFILKKTDQDTFDRMNDLFNNIADFTSLKIIIIYKNLYYKTKAEEDRILELLTELFTVDGDFSRIEKVFVPFFKRMTNF